MYSFYLSRFSCTLNSTEAEPIRRLSRLICTTGNNSFCKIEIRSFHLTHREIFVAVRPQPGWKVYHRAAIDFIGCLTKDYSNPTKMSLSVFMFLIYSFWFCLHIMSACTTVFGFFSNEIYVETTIYYANLKSLTFVACSAYRIDCLTSILNLIVCAKDNQKWFMKL